MPKVPQNQGVFTWCDDGVVQGSFGIDSAETGDIRLEARFPKEFAFVVPVLLDV